MSAGNGSSCIAVSQRAATSQSPVIVLAAMLFAGLHSFLPCEGY